MKAKLLAMTIVLITAAAFVSATIIDDVQVIPGNPTISDIIEVDIFATLSYDEVPYNTEVTIYDNSLVEIDINFGGFGLPVITSWNHTESIGLLNVGTYDLVVTTFNATQSGWDAEYVTEFTVVPEPATVLLFGVGLLGIRRSKKR